MSARKLSRRQVESRAKTLKVQRERADDAVATTRRKGVELMAPAKEAGMTVEELAGCLGITPQALYQAARNQVGPKR